MLYTRASSIVPLKNCIRVLDGFGKSLEVILPKLRDGYIVPEADVARGKPVRRSDDPRCRPRHGGHRTALQHGKYLVGRSYAAEGALEREQSGLVDLGREGGAAVVAAGSAARTRACQPTRSWDSRRVRSSCIATSRM